MKIQANPGNSRPFARWFFPDTKNTMGDVSLNGPIKAAEPGAGGIAKVRVNDRFFLSLPVSSLSRVIS